MVLINSLKRVSICTALLLVGCTDGEESWVSIDPIQCLGNPWEADWVESHPDQEYPPSEENQINIFKDFFEATGLEIEEVKVRMVYEAVCGSCACPTGERYYALVQTSDISAFLERGFMEESGPTDP